MYKRVRTLLRVSSKQQLHDDDIPVQRAEAARYIKAHRDWILDKEYLEKGISAYHNSAAEREALQEIMRDARDGAFDILLTYMSDRIGRQEEYSFYVAELNRLGIEVWTIKDGQLKTTEHMDKLLNYIRFWQNEGESKKTGMRVHDTMVEMVKDGRFVGGRAPYGYKLALSGEISSHGRALHKLVIVPEQARIVCRIYSYAVSQGMGFQKIANILNESRIPAPASEQWKAGTVRSILTNPIYMGYTAYNRRGAEGAAHQRLDRRQWVYAREQNPEIVIVSKEIWESAQEIREARKRQISAARKAASDQYMAQHHVPFTTRGRLALIGMVFCGYCGKRLRNAGYARRRINPKTGEKTVCYVGRYECSGHCRRGGAYAQEYLESLVFTVVKDCLKKLKGIDPAGEMERRNRQQSKSILREMKDLEKEAKNLEADIQTLEGKMPAAIRGEFAFSIDKLAALIREKEARKEEAEAAAKRLQRRLEELSAQSGEGMGLPKTAPQWDEVFDKADIRTKQMLLSALLAQIMVKEEEITIRFKIRPGNNR